MHVSDVRKLLGGVSYEPRSNTVEGLLPIELALYRDRSPEALRLVEREAQKLKGKVLEGVMFADAPAARETPAHRASISRSKTT